MNDYKVFTRNWWKEEDGKLVPYVGQKKHIDYFNTENEAREFCQAANTKRPASWHKLSRKYEYTKV